MKRNRIYPKNIFLSLLLVCVSGFANSAYAARKVCMDPDTGEWRIKKLACSGFFSRELNANNVITGRLISIYFHENGTRISGTDTAGTVTRIAGGFYDLETTLTDTSKCVLQVSQGLSSAGFTTTRVTFGVYTDPANLGHIRVEAYDSVGLLTDVGVHLTAICPASAT